MNSRISVLAAGGIALAAISASTFVSAAQASCNPNTGCLPRPTDVMEVGGAYGQRYVVKPRTLDIVQTRSNHIYASGLRWSKWTGGYGKNGLIPGSARGTGYLHATGKPTRHVTIYLTRVTNGGVNAFTFYKRMAITGDPRVPSHWYWKVRTGKWVVS